MHIHLGVLKALITFLEVIIVGFFWRIISMHNADNSLGQGMAVLY
jgi:hypothetical protein